MQGPVAGIQPVVTKPAARPFTKSIETTSLAKESAVRKIAYLNETSRDFGMNIRTKTMSFAKKPNVNEIMLVNANANNQLLIINSTTTEYNGRMQLLNMNSATAEYNENNATVELYENNATAEFYENNATAEFYENNATAELYENNATAELYENNATAEFLTR
ncbi:hypothetical protein F511_33324 [Dorcoceras hygrometricum]|uniref:Uncharacterized protein n=1 Tax=Dorcoceras hygrometricum TaxID=472368 RepID=A0A2Z7BCP6_9LAMI|nr:hypothetical protein F511_33324 [Dorcoceras hygrometricum]